MSAPHSLAHNERLRNRGSIRRLFEEGKSGFIYPLRYMWLAKQAEGEATGESGISCEVLFTVPKRFHKRANKRNTLRRRVKEAYRLQKSIVLSTNLEDPKNDLDLDIDLAIVYSTKEVHSYKTIENGVRKILENIAKAL